MTAIPPPPAGKPKKKPGKLPPPPAPALRKAKTFVVKPWDDSGEGEKILIYARSGMGKTTLAAMAPGPVVFIGLDDGGRKIRHPQTKKQLNFIPGIETWQDVRDALQQTSLFDDCETIVIDTITVAEALALDHTLQHVKVGGKSADNVETYGYAKGYRHWYDTFKHIKSDCDALVRRGKNIIMVAQMVPSIMSDVISWCDHVFRIDYHAVVASKKKASSSSERCVFVHPEVHFKAKSRTLGPDCAVVTFSEPADDSIWSLLFGDDNDE